MKPNKAFFSFLLEYVMSNYSRERVVAPIIIGFATSFLIGLGYAMAFDSGAWLFTTLIAAITTFVAYLILGFIEFAIELKSDFIKSYKRWQHRQDYD